MNVNRWNPLSAYNKSLKVALAAQFGKKRFFGCKAPNWSFTGHFSLFFVQATKSIYFIRDDSGRIDAMQWKDENSSSAGEDIEENSYIRVIGSVRLMSLVFMSFYIGKIVFVGN